MTRIWLFLAGLFSLWGQVLLFRELIVVFSGGELPVVLGIGMVLVAYSAGLFSFKRSSFPRVRSMFIAFSLLIVSLFLAASSVRIFFNMTSGVIIPFHEQLTAALIVLLPYGFIAGRLFGEISFLYLDEGGGVEKAYAIDTFGALFGGVIPLVFIQCGISQSASVVSLGGLAFASALIQKDPKKNIYAIPALVVFMLILPAVETYHFQCGKKENPCLKEIKETPYGRLSVSSDGAQSALFLNGSLLYESQSTSAEEFVHLPALFANKLQNALVLGGSGEGVAAELLKHAPGRMDVVELDEEFVALPKKFNIDRRFDFLNEGNARLVIGDGRGFLKEAGKYDLILSSSVDPSSITDTRFFTEDFFRLAEEHLAPDGVFAFRMRGAENLWSEVMLQRNGSVIKPLFSLFKSVAVIQQSQTLVIASNAGIPETSLLEKRWNDRKIEARLASPAYFRYLLENERRSKIENAIRKGGCEPTTDDRITSYPLTLALELSRHFPRLSTLKDIMRRGRNSALILLVLMLMAEIIYFTKARPLELIAVFCAGFWGMIFETAVLIYFQVTSGALYKDIGLLTALFMGGLCAGSLISPKAAKRCGIGLMLPLVITAAAFSWFSSLLVYFCRMGLPSVSALIFAAGGLTGGMFGLAQERYGGSRNVVLKKLYGADLLGGAAGSATGVLLMIPFLGISMTLLLVSAVLIFLSPFIVRLKGPA